MRFCTIELRTEVEGGGEERRVRYIDKLRQYPHTASTALWVGSRQGGANYGERNLGKGDLRGR